MSFNSRLVLGLSGRTPVITIPVVSQTRRVWEIQLTAGALSIFEADQFVQHPRCCTFVLPPATINLIAATDQLHAVYSLQSGAVVLPEDQFAFTLIVRHRLRPADETNVVVGVLTHLKSGEQAEFLLNRAYFELLNKA